MRYYFKLIIILSIAISCSNQKELDRYALEVSRSNKAIWEFIENRIAGIKAAAAEYPERLNEWNQLADSTLKACTRFQEDRVRRVEDLQTFNVYLRVKLDENHEMEDFPTLNLAGLNNEDSLVIQSRTLNYLNDILGLIGRKTGFRSIECYSTPRVYPQILKFEDSTLVILNTDKVWELHDLSILFNSPNNIKINDSHSIGHFYIPNDPKVHNLDGEIILKNDFGYDAMIIPFNWSLDSTNAMDYGIPKLVAE